MVTPRPAVARLPYYHPGERKARAERTHKLSSNESALGPGPGTLAAYRETAEQIHRYPDPDWIVLREALAQHHDLNAEQIVCGAGSEDLIGTLAHTYLDPGSSAVHSEFGFPLYRIVTIACDATPVPAPEKAMHADVDALLAAVRDDTRVLFLANPNNPTGTVLPFDRIRTLHEALPPHVLLVLDSAYADYLEDDPTYDSGLELVREGADNVVVTRTFSKLHGLAGLRIGWAYAAPAIVEALRRTGRTFGVNAAAQAAATAAVGDTEHLAAAVAHNAKWRAWLERELASLGYGLTNSVANFVLVHLPGDQAPAAFEFLKDHGVIVRPAAPYGLPASLRVTVGLEDENRAFIEAMKAFAGR
jgi:histidinol-phosphate aminotransferase